MGLDPAGSAAGEERGNVFEGKVTRTCDAVDVGIRRRGDENEFNT